MITIDIKKPLFTTLGELELDINLEIKEGSFVAICGESGSGKTTLLRILAGLESAKGEIKVADKIYQDSKTSLAIQKREIGFVFQDYALFPNMSVKENLLYVTKDEKLATHLLELTELTTLSERLPHTLSGGQKQRVALCRALMSYPKLLLLDEPLSALDLSIRAKLQNELLTLHKEFNLTTILVSHDPSEIYRLCDRAVILKNGKIVHDGSPKEVLLKTSGSQKFSFEARIIDIVKMDAIYVAIVSIGQQIAEIVISSHEANELKIGDIVSVGTKAFAPTISQK